MADNTNPSIEDLKAPLLAALGAADLALATVNDLLGELRERAEETRTDTRSRVEESRARLTKLQEELPEQLRDLRVKFTADELRSAAEGYVEAATGDRILGWAWAAYRWARGAKLESVLDESPDLTPGDFVRAVKQLIDLLDQIASAAPTAPARPPAEAPAPQAGPGPVPALSAEAAAVPAPWPAADPVPRTVSMTARAAIDAMRRGVVAYSAVAG